MAINLGELFVSIGARTAPLLSSVRGLPGQMAAPGKQAGSAFTRGMEGSVRTGMSGIKRIILAGLATAGIGSIGALVGQSVKKAMSAQESESLFAISMGKMSEAARAWSMEVRKATGLNDYEIRKNVSTFNVMFKSMGLGEDAAFGMSKGLTQLAIDMGSFYNLSTEEAFQKLQAGITGEAEPLKRLGILVNEATTKSYALAHGIGASTGMTVQQKKELSLLSREYENNIKKIAQSKKSTEEMNLISREYDLNVKKALLSKQSAEERQLTLDKLRMNYEKAAAAGSGKITEEQRLALTKLGMAYEKASSKLTSNARALTDNEKVMARYGAIMQATVASQGDMERTGGSLTNQMKRFRDNITRLQIVLGEQLIPGLSEIAVKMNAWIDLHGEYYAKKIGDGFAWIVAHKTGLMETAGVLASILVTMKALAAIQTIGAVAGMAGIVAPALGGAAAGGLAVGGGAAAAGALAITAATIIPIALAVIATAGGVYLLASKLLKADGSDTWLGKKFFPGADSTDNVTPRNPATEPQRQANLEKARRSSSNFQKYGGPSSPPSTGFAGATNPFPSLSMWNAPAAPAANPYLAGNDRLASSDAKWAASRKRRRSYETAQLLGTAGPAASPSPQMQDAQKTTIIINGLTVMAQDALTAAGFGDVLLKQAQKFQPA